MWWRAARTRSWTIRDSIDSGIAVKLRWRFTVRQPRLTWTGAGTTLRHGRAGPHLRLEPGRPNRGVRLGARAGGPERRNLARRPPVALGDGSLPRREETPAPLDGGPRDRGRRHRVAGSGA